MLIMLTLAGCPEGESPTILLNSDAILDVAPYVGQDISAIRLNGERSPIFVKESLQAISNMVSLTPGDIILEENREYRKEIENLKIEIDNVENINLSICKNFSAMRESKAKHRNAVLKLLRACETWGELGLEKLTCEIRTDLEINRAEIDEVFE